MQNYTLGLWLCSVASVALGSSQAMAQASPSSPSSAEAPTATGSASDGLADIVVTAQKRSQSIERVPASIQVQTGETISAYQQLSLKNIAVTIPNLILTQAPSGSVSANIRGFGTPTANAGFEQTVGLFIDGVYAPRPQSYSGSIFDVERIEVVKGTQGTLFGKNAEVGGISLVTRAPGREFGGFVNASYDFRMHEPRVEGAVDLPASPRLRVRIAGLYDDQNKGWITNRATGSQQPTSREYGARARAVWEATDTLTINAKGEFNNLRGDGDALYGVGGPLFAGVTADNASKNASSNLIPENGGQTYRTRRSDVQSVGFDWHVGDHTITDITAWQRLRFTTTADFDQTTGPFDFVNYFSENFHQFSQELRIASDAAKRFSYVAGVFYLNQTLHNGLETRFARAPARNLLTIEDQVYSGFAQGVFKATDRLTLTAGGRYTHETKDGSLAVVKNAGSATTRQNVTDNSFDWSLIGEYEVVDGTRAYATVSRGHKAKGALNSVPGAALSPASLFITGEKATNYEVGIKSRFLDNRARASVSLYHLDVGNFQGSEFNPALGSFVTSNINARAQGVEASLQLRVLTGLTLNMSGAYNDAVIRSNGNQMPGAPKFNGTLGIDYDRSIGANAELQMGTLVTYTSKFPHQFDLNPYNFTPGHHNVDAHVGVHFASQQLTVSLVGKNLTDQRYTEFAFGNPAAPGLSFNHQLNRPRSLAISLEKAF